MKTLQKRSLFWDVKDLNPDKDKKFIIERILTYGDKDDFKWALKYYGEKTIKEYFLKSKILDKRSSFFWCQYFNFDPSQCIRNQSAQKQSAFWKR